jgi:hypothetical protein
MPASSSVCFRVLKSQGQENLFRVKSLLLKIENRRPVNNYFGILYMKLGVKQVFYKDLIWDGF